MLGVQAPFPQHPQRIEDEPENNDQNDDDNRDQAPYHTETRAGTEIGESTIGRKKCGDRNCNYQFRAVSQALLTHILNPGDPGLPEHDERRVLHEQS